MEDLTIDIDITTASYLIDLINSTIKSECDEKKAKMLKELKSKLDESIRTATLIF